LVDGSHAPAAHGMCGARKPMSIAGSRSAA